MVELNICHGIEGFTGWFRERKKKRLCLATHSGNKLKSRFIVGYIVVWDKLRCSPLNTFNGWDVFGLIGDESSKGENNKRLGTGLGIYR